MRRALLLSSFCLSLVAGLPIRLPQDPCISPDGSRAWFAWQGDIWSAPVAGGDAARFTQHPADDAEPRLSPDGKQVAFLSRRTGTEQVFLAPVQGGAPRQVTFDGNAKTLLGFTPDGRHILVIETLDLNPHRVENRRLLRVSLGDRKAPEILLDAALDGASLSPDGTQVLFTRGRVEWWRKGFESARAYQIWLADLSTRLVSYRRLSVDKPHFQNVSENWPLWAPGGKGYYFVSEEGRVKDVCYRNLDGTGLRRITRVDRDKSDDGVVFPSLSADGRTLLFRRRFDLMTADTATGKLNALELRATGDEVASPLEPRVDRKATGVAFTKDGKQMAFVAGDDIWVMDTLLKEPVRVTRSAAREDSLAFGPDGKTLYWAGEADGQVDLFAVDCPREDGAWFLAKDFAPRRLTRDEVVEGNVKPDPTGQLVACERGRDLWVMKPDGKGVRKLVGTWSGVNYDWSPDGRWIVYATQDESFNSDVWVVPADGHRPPFNLSRHPDNDVAPRWSPDGTRIAYTGRRESDEMDIHVVTLSKTTEEETARDRTLKKAVAALHKGGSRREAPVREDAPEPTEAPAARDSRPARGARPVVIDFDSIHNRIHRIRFAGTERDLLWSPDGTRLGFTHSTGARGDEPTSSLDAGNDPAEQRARPGATPAPGARPVPGTPTTPASPAAVPAAAAAPATATGPAFFTVAFPDKLTPERIVAPALSSASWVEAGALTGLADGVPATLALNPVRTTTHAFTVHTTRDWREYRTVVLDQAWRALRDGFYDGAFNNRDWNAIHRKYRELAPQCLGRNEFESLVQLMLGELNSSHQGYPANSACPDFLPVPDPAKAPAPKPFHLGLRFDRTADGEGLRVASVIPGSPCALNRSRVEPGERLLAIDGTPVSRDTDLSGILAMSEPRDLDLKVAGTAGATRTVKARPVASVSELLYDEWVDANRAEVERQSGGRFGYLHIKGMDMPSFRRFEEDLYHAGYGKEGLIVDVRYNGGGSTADHILTALTQPVHAITVPRGGTPGYPQDRMVYATWTRPIVLMCNEHSFSNAEIISHAIKTLGRGRLVGMRTAGGVISTGSVRLQDGSAVRMPGRGWHLRDSGEDMELNGAEPHLALWNPPAGPDVQLATAVKALAEDVAKSKPRPKLVKASERSK